MTKIELLWEYYKDQKLSAERYDHQRTSITGFVFISASALLAVLGNQGFGQYATIASILLISVGIISLALVRKLHERSELNYSRARIALDLIEEEINSPLYETLKTISYEKHSNKYGNVTKIPLHITWMIPNIFIIGVGIISLVESWR